MVLSWSLVIQTQVSLKFIFSPRLMILGILLHNLKMMCRVLHDPSLTLTSEPQGQIIKFSFWHVYTISWINIKKISHCNFLFFFQPYLKHGLFVCTDYAFCNFLFLISFDLFVTLYRLYIFVFFFFQRHLKRG